MVVVDKKRDFVDRNSNILHLIFCREIHWRPLSGQQMNSFNNRHAIHDSVYYKNRVDGHSPKFLRTHVAICNGGGECWLVEAATVGRVRKSTKAAVNQTVQQGIIQIIVVGKGGWPSSDLMVVIICTSHVKPRRRLWRTVQ